MTPHDLAEKILELIVAPKYGLTQRWVDELEALLTAAMTQERNEGFLKGLSDRGGEACKNEISRNVLAAYEECAKIAESMPEFKIACEIRRQKDALK